MPQDFLLKTKEETKLQEAILATLAFFGLHKIPLSTDRIWQLLYKLSAPKKVVKNEIEKLVQQNYVNQYGNFYSLDIIDSQFLDQNRKEVRKRLQKIDKYYWLLSMIPFVEQLSIINSLAMGNASAESDIDFFVITKPRRLYFVRTVIIVLFRLLGIYKTRTKIADQFCFGFYVTTDSLDLENALIAGEDPHFAFWFASFIPLFGKRQYERLVAKNRWIYSYCPNFLPSQKSESYKPVPNFSNFAKKFLNLILALPAELLEPILRFIHIRHTFNLPENSWPTSTTIAEKDILKLHALDPRKDVRDRFFGLLQSLK